MTIMASRAAHFIRRSDIAFRLCTSHTHHHRAPTVIGRRSQSTLRSGLRSLAIGVLLRLLVSRGHIQTYNPKEFPEEPIGYPAEAGFGFYQGGPGDILEGKGMYEILAKLGTGATSSVWLARDWDASR